MPASPTPPRRILFVTGTGYLPRSMTGANISLDALCLRLAAAGYDPVVVCAADPPARAGARAGATDPGYTVLRLPDPVEAMKEMVLRLEPYAVVARAPWPAIRAVRWAAATGRRVHVYWESVSFEQGFPPPSEAPSVRYAACSPFLARIARALLGYPVEYIPPLIEPQAYRCAPDGDAILFVNPVPIKGARLVARIAERLAHRQFLFVPSWPEQADLDRIDIRLPNVMRAETTADMRGLYARARLVLMPSIWEEAWGRIVSEAQISGIPAVVSDRGGLPEAVAGGGIVLSVADPVERWCDAIETLFTDTERYQALSRAAVQSAARPELAPENVVARFLAFLAT